MNKKIELLVLICFALGLGAWMVSAQDAPEPMTDRDHWMRVIQSEMDLTPRMTRTFQPRNYQTVQVVIGAGEFAPTSRESFQRAAVPIGEARNFRIDTSDPDFLIAAVGYIDNLGQWRNNTVHYIPWSKVIDVYFLNSRIVSSGVPR